MTITPSEMKEINGECCQTNCTNTATHYMYWPGQGKKMVCTECAQKAKAVGRAMGVDIYIEAKDE